MKTYTMGFDWRTESPTASSSARKAIREALASAGLPQARDFVAVFADGSGKMWGEWPNMRETIIPPGTFPDSLR